MNPNGGRFAHGVWEEQTKPSRSKAGFVSHADSLSVMRSANPNDLLYNEGRQLPVYGGSVVGDERPAH